MDEDLKLALLEAIWVMRWNKNQTAMAAVLTEEEADSVCLNILEELDNAGYEIIKIPEDKTTRLIKNNTEFLGEMLIVECCKRGPITDENYCPFCGKEIIKNEH